MREKQPSIEERILDIEMKMAETGPWPADFPATSGELGVRIRAVVREMDRESSSRTREWAKQAIMSICIDQYMRKSSSPLFREAVKGNKRLRTAARVAAEKMEEVETFGEGNPWSEAIYESLDAEVRG